MLPSSGIWTIGVEPDRAVEPEALSRLAPMFMKNPMAACGRKEEADSHRCFLQPPSIPSEFRKP